MLNFHDADIDLRSSGNEFIVDDVLQQMRLLRLAVVQPGIAEAHVLRIVLRWIGKGFASLHIVALGLPEQIRLHQVLHKGFQRMRIGLNLLRRFQRVPQPADIGQASHAAHQHVNQIFEQQIVLDFIMFDNVLDVQGREKTG